MNTLVQILANSTPTANKHFRAWYESNEEEFNIPFATFIMFPNVFVQEGIFRQYFRNVHNVDITVAEIGYDIYAAVITESVINDFRFEQMGGVFYVEQKYTNPIANDAYRHTLAKRYEYWTIKAIAETMSWIETFVKL